MELFPCSVTNKVSKSCKNGSHFVFESQSIYTWYLTCMIILKGTPYDLTRKFEIPPAIFKNTIFIKIQTPARKLTFGQFRKKKHKVGMFSKTSFRMLSGNWKLWNYSPCSVPSKVSKSCKKGSMFVFESESIYPWYLTCMIIHKGTPYDLSGQYENPPEIFETTFFIKIQTPKRKLTFC